MALLKKLGFWSKYHSAYAILKPFYFWNQCRKRSDPTYCILSSVYCRSDILSLYVTSISDSNSESFYVGSDLSRHWLKKNKWLGPGLPLIWWKSLDSRDFQVVLSLVSEWKPSWLVDVNPIDVKYLRTGLSPRNSSISTFVFKNKYSKNKKKVQPVLDFMKLSKIICNIILVW